MSFSTTDGPMGAYFQTEDSSGTSGYTAIVSFSYHDQYGDTTDVSHTVGGDTFSDNSMDAGRIGLGGGFGVYTHESSYTHDETYDDTRTGNFTVGQIVSNLGAVMTDYQNFTSHVDHVSQTLDDEGSYTVEGSTGFSTATDDSSRHKILRHRRRRLQQRRLRRHHDQQHDRRDQRPNRHDRLRPLGHRGPPDHRRPHVRRHVGRHHHRQRPRRLLIHARRHQQLDKRPAEHVERPLDAGRLDMNDFFSCQAGKPDLVLCRGRNKKSPRGLSACGGFSLD